MKKTDRKMRDTFVIDKVDSKNKLVWVWMYNKSVQFNYNEIEFIGFNKLFAYIKP